MVTGNAEVKSQDAEAYSEIIIGNGQTAWQLQPTPIKTTEMNRAAAIWPDCLHPGWSIPKKMIHILKAAAKTPTTENILSWKKIGFGVAVLAVIATAWQAYVANDSEKRSLRAYMGLHAPADGQIVSNFAPPARASFHLIPKNYGQTPAYFATQEIGSGVYSYPLPKTFAYPIEEVATLPNRLTIFPGDLDSAGINSTWNRPLTADEFASIKDASTNRLYTWGTIKYKDAFGYWHYTNFCWSFYDITSTQSQRAPCTGHNDSD